MKPLPTHVTLWENAAGISCVSIYPQAGPQFEITIVHGEKIIARMSFEHYADAADFAIASMNQDDSYWRRIMHGPAVNGENPNDALSESESSCRSWAERLRRP